MTVTAQDVERTARDTNIALWGVASVVMAGSMVAGGFAFHHLNQSWWSAAVGVVTALAVDLALAQWLRIGRRIRAAGAEVVWGRVLEFTTAGMTLYLNVGAALFIGVDPETAKRLLAVAHTFLPVVLVLVSLAGGEAQLKLQQIRRDTEAAERAERDAQLAVDRAAHEAEQHRIQAERDRENERQDQIRRDSTRAVELADENRREERAFRAWELSASMASVTALGAAWRSRPRPKRVSARRPSEPTSPPPAAVPVTDQLVSQAKRFRVDRESQGLSAGRAVLQQKFKLTERAARELVRRLDETPLHAVGSER